MKYDEIIRGDITQGVTTPSRVRSDNKYIFLTTDKEVVILSAKEIDIIYKHYLLMK